MEFKQLEALIQTTKHRSFSQAAQSMEISLPTVITHISALEKELGCELLIKSGKELTPTSQGLLLMRYATDILALREEAVATMSKPEILYSGNLTIASSSVPSALYLNELMNGFTQKYQHITYQIHHTNSQQVIEEVRKGVADVGFTGMELPDCGCVFYKIATDDLVIVTANNPQYAGLLPHQFPKELLLSKPFLEREQGSGTRIATEERLVSMGIEPKSLNIVAEMNHIGSIKESVREGLGIAILSASSVKQECEKGTLLAFSLGENSVKRDLFIALRQNRPEVSQAHLLLNFTLEYFG